MIDTLTVTLSVRLNMLKRSDISDLDNKVIINCGGVRHETYKVTVVVTPTSASRVIIHKKDDLEEDSCHPTLQTDGGSC